jgi:hypothetical protein
MEAQSKLFWMASQPPNTIFYFGRYFLKDPAYSLLPYLCQPQDHFQLFTHRLMQLKSVISALLLLFAVQLLFAQRGQVVLETERSMSFGTRPCFRLEFDNADADLVEDTWKNFAKQRFEAKLKKDKKSGEWSAAKINNVVLGEDVTLYSTIEKMSKGVALNVWVDHGSYFLNRKDNAGRAEELSRSLRECYYEVRRAVIGKELKAEENVMKDLEKKQKSLTKDNESLRKDIEEWKVKIQKAETQITNNEKAQETNLVDQEAQKRLLEEVRRRLQNVENEGN